VGAVTAILVGKTRFMRNHALLNNPAVGLKSEGATVLDIRVADSPVEGSPEIEKLALRPVLSPVAAKARPSRIQWRSADDLFGVLALRKGEVDAPEPRTWRVRRILGLRA
jgi:hypothetical protein